MCLGLANDGKQPAEMTDKEIIKALECCVKSNCGECPIFNNSEIRRVPGRCIVTLEKNALDLITRQQAEIDDLKRDTIPKLQEALKRANKYGLETDKENEQLKAEIEKLKGFVSPTVKLINEYDISVAKIEAIKELVEWFKSEHSNLTLNDEISVDMLVCDINRFIKEMEGADNV